MAARNAAQRAPVSADDASQLVATDQARKLRQANLSSRRCAWGKPQVLGTARAANETEKAMKRIRVKMLLLFD
ncbi:hypothetical protein, conserved [Eimeria tenella]|uniref:Uncharacterized protein n=1 Tax=Eimeria tenella TaxID=5802 RepID=U6KTH6_EIMTE|nr:hypothetical protein, conserved [Eimeria tenella]CDJ41271.1 hypothetical protein, conserved [Eimeria tenella]|eukprot:XP_013232021.1 hypothetical protein, conserved [Eimeria tenella]